MSSVKSTSSAGDSACKDLDRQHGRGGEIIKMGYLKKLKTMKKKFFVLRSESSEASARLEYYDSEKKWKQHQSPKRSIALKTCFNINRRTDTKHKHVIALYTKDDCFCVVLESEEELEEWLNSLLSLQHGEDMPEGEPPKPTFEHIWQVTMQRKGLGVIKHILGPYLLCLTDKTVSLVNKNQERPETYEFELGHVRRCGHSDCFFYMEMGRSACTGAGDLWMQTEDPNIAQNMHAAILSAMSNTPKEEPGPRPRTRSSSAIEASKPITMNTRKTSQLGIMKTPSYYSTSEEVARGGGHLNFVHNRVQPTATYAEHPSMSPSTPDAMHSQVCVGSLPGSYHCHHTHRVAPIHPPVPTSAVRPSQRRHSVSAMCVSSMGGTGSGSACNTTNNAPLGAPTHHRTYSFPLSEPSSGLAPALAPPSWDGRRASTGRPAGKRSGASSSRSSTAAGRERCDSLPSRARTTSEGHPQPPPHALPTPAPRGAHLAPGHGGAVRPHSMYTRGVSYSPPVGSSPVSPASGACSTDSAGSSLSIDDTGDGWNEEGMVGMSRYSTSLTPDEPAIMEVEEYAHWPGPGSGDGNYLPMDRNQTSLSLSIQSATVSTVTAPHRKISPNLSSSGFKSGSPSQGSYMEMYSPCGSSPMENTGGYMTMSPGAGGSAPLEATPRMQICPRAASSANHSRGSSLAEDGYVPMGPTLNDDGYVDMDPMNPIHGHEHFHHSEMSPASSCSITSGTPSTDLRFSEYHLEKVSSYFTPSEEDETSSLDRPIPRAYSVGSRPENLKKPTRLEGQSQATDPASRVRAFSVGSRGPPGGKGTVIASRSLVHDPASGPRFLPSVMGATLTPPGHLLHTAMAQSVSVTSNKKSSSAPLLSNSWSGSGSSSLRHGPHSSHSSVEPMDDLMEMDFTRTPKATTKNSSKTVSRTKGDNALPPHHSSPFPEKSCATLSGYVDMTPRSVGSSSKVHTPTSGPYLEMKPGFPESTSTSPPSSSVISKSPKSSIHSGPYVEMKPGLPPDSQVCNSGDSRAQSVPISVPCKPTTVSVSPKTHVNPYVEMRAGSGISEIPRKTSVSISPPSRPTVITSAISTTSKPFTSEEVPYVPMKPGCFSSESSLSFPFTKPIPVPTSSGPYMDMKPGPGGNCQPQSLPPTTPHRSTMTPTNISPKSMSFNVGPYVEMSQSSFTGSSSFNRQSSRKPASPIQEEYVDMSLKPVRKTSRQDNIVTVIGSSVINRTAPVDTPQPKMPPEGYVEMSWNRGNKSSPKSSLDDYKSPPSSNQDDYMNMSFEGRGSLSKRKERRNSQKEKTRYSSQPIAIGGPPKDGSGKTSSASTSPVFSFMGRKSSTGTPPKIPPGYLPLGGGGSGGTASPSGSPFSSLRRSRKTSGGSRRESGDASSGLTTPTGSTTIFPLSLNSPGSPMKPFPGSTGTPSSIASKSLLHSAPGSDVEQSHKCPVDATSGTVRISYSYSEMPLSASTTASTPATPDSSSSSEQPTPVNTLSVDDITKVEDSRNHDYVNYCPGKTQTRGLSRDDEFGDYALMRPVPVVRAGIHEATRKISAPTFGVMNRRFNNIHQGVANLTLSSPTLNSSKTVNTSREITPPITRKASFNSPLPSSSPLCRPSSKSTTGIMNMEIANGPKVIENEGSCSLSRQPSNASCSSKTSSSSKDSKGSRQLSRSSSGSSEVGRTLEASRSEEKSDTQSTSESLSIKSEDSGTISPASSHTAVASRPPSVSSERELHYASLDLAPSGSEGEDGARSPRTLKTQGSLTESSNSSPSPNPVHSGMGGVSGGEAFTYAEIDFSRQDGPRSSTSSLSSSKKVKQ